MSKLKKSPISKVLRAISFAAKCHDGQLRKDGVTPYFSHPVRVMLILRHVFGVETEQALMAAVLHDVLEDTDADYDALREQFGDDVARWVAILSKDKRLSEQTREEKYLDQFRGAPAELLLIKAADLYDNLLDVNPLRKETKKKLVKRATAFLKLFQRSRDLRVRKAVTLIKKSINSTQAF